MEVGAAGFVEVELVLDAVEREAAACDTVG